MRPSEIIAHALSSGELTPEDVTPSAADGADAAGGEVAAAPTDLPSVPQDKAEDAGASPPAAPTEDAVLSGVESTGERAVGDEAEDSAGDSDRESDYAPDENAEKNDDDEEVRTIAAPALVSF